jgi:hypothetical protein
VLPDATPAVTSTPVVLLVIGSTGVLFALLMIGMILATSIVLSSWHSRLSGRDSASH